MVDTLRRKLHNLLADKKFAEILTGSAFALSARVAGTGLSLLGSILVARVYGAEMTGVLAIVQSFMMLATIFALLGTNVSILRLIPEHLAKYSATSALRVYRKALWLVVMVSLLVGGTLLFGAEMIATRVFSKPHFASYIALTACFVLSKAIMDLSTEAVRGLRLIRMYAFMQFLPHASVLVILSGLVVFSHQPNDPVYAQLAGWSTTALVGALIVDRAFRLQVQTSDEVQPLPLSNLIAISAPMLMTASIYFLNAQVGVLIVGMYSTASEVGYYSAAVKLATLTSFVLQAINSMAAPKFSELFHTGRMEELFYVAKKSTKLIFWTTIPLLIVLIILGRYALRMFGEDFTTAYFPMLILVAGQFVNSVSGSTGHFMNMTGDQGKFRDVIAAASIVNLMLCFILTPHIGIYGAAIAGTVSLSLWNISVLIHIKNKYGKTIGYLPFLGR